MDATLVKDIGIKALLVGEAPKNSLEKMVGLKEYFPLGKK